MEETKEPSGDGNALTFGLFFKKSKPNHSKLHFLSVYRADTLKLLCAGETKPLQP